MEAKLNHKVYKVVLTGGKCDQRYILICVVFLCAFSRVFSIFAGEYRFLIAAKTPAYSFAEFVKVELRTFSSFRETH